MDSSQQWAQAILVILLVLAIVFMTSGYRRGVLRLRKNGQMLIDHDGWTVTLADDRIWLARFSEDWRRRYGSSWAIGYKRTHVWFYTSKGERHEED